MGSTNEGRATPADGRWSGERIGRLSLRLDAAYCTVLGIGVAFAAPLIAGPLPLPVAAVVAIGVAVAVWAGVVLLLLARLSLRAALRCVLSANVVAALGIAAFSTTGATVLLLLAVLGVAVDVALFAWSQAMALRRLRPAVV
ncbi:hypothetical protein GCM10025864_01760 [Luteimicrobium album]|uniref:Integral membrane protein n=1 Tax=Luteimicrobium album TaxID=1054550 RepID=A0ABQ6HW83_9MICO|nr:hypothetical protein [Luteimicrobium album]GMA22417.1 hypothetical protein GCM10025864_01760 [Luteimicrobium album]